MVFERERREAQHELTGHPVVDSELARVGTVTDVLGDEPVGVARWLVVKTGLVSAEHLVPVDDTYLDTDGRLVVPLNKNAVKRAPRVRRDHTLTPPVRRELRDYYGIAA
jgi:rRNA processing protein Gar1